MYLNPILITQSACFLNLIIFIKKKNNLRHPVLPLCCTSYFNKNGENLMKNK